MLILRFMLCSMRPSRGSQGFSLLELLAVLVILIVIAGLSIAQIRLPQNLDGTARQISGLIQALHDKSRASKLMYRLHFNINTGKYWVTSVKGNLDLPAQETLYRNPRSLPQDVQFQGILVSHRGYGRENDMFMQFYPIGRVEPTVIYLMNQVEERSLLVHPITGSVRIMKGHYVPRTWKDVST